MKVILNVIPLLLLCNIAIAQIEGSKEISEAEAVNLGGIKTRGIKFGVSTGFNKALDEIYDARISPIDTSFKLERASNVSFLLSTTLSFAILKGWLGGSYYRKLGADGQPVGNPYFVPKGLNIIATLNLVTFNSALAGAGLFNQKLDGGLGLGYTFGDNVQIGATYEMLSFRQPREYLMKLRDKPVIVNGDKMTSLPTDNNDYFIDKYIPSISLKIIYTLSSDK